LRTICYIEEGIDLKMREMRTINIDAIIKENQELMQQIRENREKFWKKTAATPKNK
jgi:hypothetical protein